MIKPLQFRSVIASDSFSSSRSQRDPSVYPQRIELKDELLNLHCRSLLTNIPLLVFTSVIEQTIKRRYDRG